MIDTDMTVEHGGARVSGGSPGIAGLQHGERGWSAGVGSGRVTATDGHFGVATARNGHEIHESLTLVVA